MWQDLLKEDVEPDMLSHGNVIRTVVGDRLYSKIEKFTTISSRLNIFLNQRAFNKQVYDAWSKTDNVTKPSKRRTYTEADAEEIRSLKPESQDKEKTPEEIEEEQKRRELIDTLTEEVKKPGSTMKKSSEFKDFLRTKYGRVKESETRLVNILKDIKDSPKGVPLNTLLKDIEEAFSDFYSERPSQRGVKAFEAEPIAKKIPEKLLTIAEELASSIGNLGSDEQTLTMNKTFLLKF